MQIRTLWIDDDLSQGVIYRVSLAKIGIDVDVAPSFEEAKLNIERHSYDLVFMRPELKLGGSSYYDTEEIRKRNPVIPFASKIVGAMRESETNKKTPLHFFTFVHDFSEECRNLREGLIREEILGNNSISKDGLTKLVTFRSYTPSAFSYGTKEAILEGEMDDYQKARELSRTDW